MPSTELIYLQNTYLFELEATVLNVFEQENQTVLVLDQTIFYPQGGGQPSDVGFIENVNGKFEVKKCIFNLDGSVWHLGSFVDGHFATGEVVKLKIDSEKRLINAKNHTAGHAIDWAVASLNWTIAPVKGFHFPEGPYVEYAGEMQIDEQKKLDLEQRINEIIGQNPSIDFLFQDYAHESGKPMRVMQVQNQKDCPCGGTHVKSTLEIGKIGIKKIKSSKGKIKISYLVMAE